jgi:hypothetical protein
MGIRDLPATLAEMGRFNIDHERERFRYADGYLGLAVERPTPSVWTPGSAVTVWQTAAGGWLNGAD